MTKQEEIKKMLERMSEDEQLTLMNVLVALDEAGVVIKVDRELPDFKLPMHISVNSSVGIVARQWHEGTQAQMLKAGYEAVEPLIKE